MRDRERFSPAQCRGARGLLAWEPEDLAQSACLDIEAVELYEAAEAELSERELEALGGAFARAGVIAISAQLGGEGVRFVQPRRTGFAGPDDALFPSHLRGWRGR